jgi:glycosyltransferase involved in cell wall biosynthesis
MLLGITFSFLIKSLRIYQNNAKPDLVYAHNQYAALAGYLLSRLWRCPNVTRLYGTFLADLMEKPLVTLRYPTAAAGFLVPSSLLICANDGTRGNTVAEKFKIDPIRFRFWQNGVTPPPASPKTDRAMLASRLGPQLRIHSKWVISCSRLSYWKRIDRMIRALAVCREMGTDCQLLIAGEGTEREALEKLGGKLGVSRDIIWLGAVAHDDIWALMNAADAFMITNDVTNRCNPLFEAAWAGLPVVSIFDPSTADLLSDYKNALLADKEDTQSLGAKLVEICSNDALAKQLRAEQKALAASFWSWQERMKIEVMELKRLAASREDPGKRFSQAKEKI